MAVPARAARHLALAGALVLLAAPLAAQEPPSDQVRAQIASARLGAGYAQMINLSATPDLSAASYRIHSIDPSAKLDVLRLPYEAKWFALSPDADLDWRVAAGWLQFKQEFPYATPSATDGNIGSRWTAYSAGAGLGAKYRLGNGLTLEPAIDFGLARLDNRASYNGEATALQPFLDGLLFNWNASAWLVTPSVALGWTAPLASGIATVRGHVARSWIGSFGETDPVQHFNEAANIYSLRAEYLQPTAWKLFDRALAGVAYAGYAGFFGANRDALGFDAVTEVGVGLELPIAADRSRAERARLAAAYLFGPGVEGWSIGVNLQF
jgi:hypothetical protein